MTLMKLKYQRGLVALYIYQIKRAKDHRITIHPSDLPKFWSRKPSNMAYVMRKRSGLDIRNTINPIDGRITFQMKLKQTKTNAR